MRDGVRVRTNYDMGEIDIFVPANITLYRVSFERPSLLKRGMAVTLTYDKTMGPRYTGRFITVEKDGRKPISDKPGLARVQASYMIVV
jgi:hypothetical protein